MRAHFWFSAKLIGPLLAAIALAGCASPKEADYRYRPDNVVERKLEAAKASIKTNDRQPSPSDLVQTTQPQLVAATMPTTMPIEPQGTTDPRKKAALLIGNSTYGFGPLRNPANDVRGIGKELLSLGFDVTVVVNANESRMDQEIAKFSRKLADNFSVALFYFAGHGMQIDGENYLLPVGEQINSDLDVKYKSVNLNKVLDSMGRYGDRLNIAIFDACRDNPLPRSNRSGFRGLAQVVSPKGSIIAYSTAPGHVAFDGDGQFSPFAKYFIAGLNKKGLSVESFFKNVLIGVNTETKGNQIPWLSSSYTGDFSFNP